MVGVAVVGGDDGLIAHSLCCLHNIVQALVNHLYGLSDGGIDARVAHHISVGQIHHNPVILIGLECIHQLVLHLNGRHGGLQVICGDFW